MPLDALSKPVLDDQDSLDGVWSGTAKVKYKGSEFTATLELDLTQNKILVNGSVKLSWSTATGSFSSDDLSGFIALIFGVPTVTMRAELTGPLQTSLFFYATTPYPTGDIMVLTVSIGELTFPITVNKTSS